ncbi:hypothetical protein LCGC14_0142990 [marine sediment metagenome]|uniref:Uncharacterized protein n=1 Tax=marine sediment metagenome TaxID=412755 RepID=A0A0F9Y2W8_9ZZZZ
MQSVMIFIGVLVGFLITVVLFSAIFALPVLWLWNVLCPDIFGLQEIGFLQAWGLSILCGFLFKSHNSK